MAWEARSGLKQEDLTTSAMCFARLNGLGSPFGFETEERMFDAGDNQFG